MNEEIFLTHFNNCNLPALCKRMEPESDELRMKFLLHDGMCLQYIRIRSPEMLTVSLKTSQGMSYQFFTESEKTPELTRLAIHLSEGYCLPYIPNPSPDMLLQIVKISPILLRQIRPHTYELVKCAVNKDPATVNCVKDKAILKQLALDGFVFPRHTLLALGMEFL